MERFGPFQLHESLGSSDVKAVNRAELLGLDGRPMSVVLRRLHPGVVGNQVVVERFIREAQLGLFLQHANVVRTFEVGQLENTVFVASELVPGASLQALLAARAAHPMPVPIALAILVQICDALDHAHTLRDQAGQPLGILHGELVPGHILVGETGEVKLIAFGRHEPHPAKLPYMAPEFLGTGMRDARADLWGLGVIAHEMLANAQLFAGANDTDIVTRIHSQTIQPPSTSNPAIPSDVDGIVMTALARDPAYRWQLAAQLRDALRASIERNQLAVTREQIAAWLRRPVEQQVPAAPAAVDEQPTEQPKPAGSGPVKKLAAAGMVLPHDVRAQSIPGADAWNDGYTSEATQIRGPAYMDPPQPEKVDDKDPVVEVDPPDAPDDEPPARIHVPRLQTETPIDLESFLEPPAPPPDDLGIKLRTPAKPSTPAPTSTVPGLSPAPSSKTPRPELGSIPVPKSTMPMPAMPGPKPLPGVPRSVPSTPLGAPRPTTPAPGADPFGSIPPRPLDVPRAAPRPTGAEPRPMPADVPRVTPELDAPAPRPMPDVPRAAPRPMPDPDPFGSIPAPRPMPDVPRAAPPRPMPDPDPFGSIPAPRPMTDVPRAAPPRPMPDPDPFGSIPARPMPDVPRAAPPRPMPDPDPFGSIPARPMPDVPRAAPPRPMPDPDPFGSIPAPRPMADVPRAAPPRPMPDPDPFGSIPPPRPVVDVPRAAPRPAAVPEPGADPFGSIPAPRPVAMPDPGDDPFGAAEPDAVAEPFGSIPEPGAPTFRATPNPGAPVFRATPNPFGAAPAGQEPELSAIDLNAFMGSSSDPAMPVSPTASTEPATPLFGGDDDPARHYPRPLTIDFGPEPTAIGAVPLISSASSAPLMSLVGEPRLPGAPPPVAVTMRPTAPKGGGVALVAATQEDEEEKPKRSWLPYAIAGGAVVLLGGIAVVLAFVLEIFD